MRITFEERDVYKLVERRPPRHAVSHGVPYHTNAPENEYVVGRSEEQERLADGSDAGEGGLFHYARESTNRGTDVRETDRKEIRSDTVENVSRGWRPPDHPAPRTSGRAG